MQHRYGKALHFCGRIIRFYIRQQPPRRADDPLFSVGPLHKDGVVFFAVWIGTGVLIDFREHLLLLPALLQSLNCCVLPSCPLEFGVCLGKICQWLSDP